LYKSENSTTLFNYNNAKGKSRFRVDVAKGKVKYPDGKTGFLSGKELNGLHYLLVNLIPEEIYIGSSLLVL